VVAIGLAALALFAPDTTLTITAWPAGRDAGAARTWRLACDPARGTVPRAAAACRQLGSVAAPFAPTPRDRACTEVWGGPQEALVRGRHAGRAVWARFSRRNGCEIARWDRVRALFPIRVGAF
jgi:hypothetical protein